MAIKTILTGSIIVASLYLQAQENNSLTLKVSGYNNNSGKIYIAIYNSKESYLNNNKAYHLEIFNPSRGITNCTVKNIPNGEYAVAIFYDENGNGKMDFNIFGAPAELYGFSNNARGFFSSPKYEKTKIVHSGSDSFNILLK